MRKFIALAYCVLISLLIPSLAFPVTEQRKGTQEDLEWGDPATTVISPGGHVGHKIPVYWDNDAQGWYITNPDTHRIGSPSFSDNVFANDVISAAPLVDVRRYIPASLHAAIAARTDNTDLSAYLQAAEDNVATTGGGIFYPCGLYNNKTAKITTKSNVGHYGLGICSEIKNWYDGDLYYADNVLGSSYISFRGLYITDGLRTSGITSTRTTGSAFHLGVNSSVAKRIVFDRVDFAGHQYVFDITNPSAVSISNSYGVWPRKDAIIIRSDQTAGGLPVNVKIDTVGVSGAGRHGLSADNTYRLHVLNSYFDGGGLLETGDGVHTVQCTDPLFESTSGEENTGYGFYDYLSTGGNYKGVSASKVGGLGGARFMSSRKISIDGGTISTVDGYGITAISDNVIDPADIIVKNMTITEAASGDVYDPLGVIHRIYGTHEYRGTLKIPATDFTAIGNVGTGEDTLMSVTIPSGVFGTDNQVIHVYAEGDYGANGNGKVLKLYWGSTALATITGNDNGTKWNFDARIVRIGATSQRGSGRYTSDNTTFSSTGFAGAFTENLTTDNVIIKLTGTATDNNDIVQRGMIVTFER